MMHKIKNNKGAALIIWILVIAIIAMIVIIVMPLILDVDGSRAKAEDEAHEQSCLDSAYLEFVAGSSFDAVYDYYEKRFVGLNEHPYQVQAYGSTKDHQDCVLMVHCNGDGNIQLTWISRQVLRERYR